MNKYEIIVNKAVSFIIFNIDKNISVNEIAEHVGISKYHFHRIFRSVTGESINEFKKRKQLEKVANMLLRTDKPFIEIGYECGFSSPEIFSREFKKMYSVSPREYKKIIFGKSTKSQELLLKNDYTLITDRIGNFRESDVWKRRVTNQDNREKIMSWKIQRIDKMDIAYLRYTGSYRNYSVFRIWQKLKKICNEFGIKRPVNLPVGIIYDNPNITSDKQCMFDACFIIDREKKEELKKCVKLNFSEIPEGYYAIFEFYGKLIETHSALNWIYRRWIFENDYILDDFPPFCIYKDKVSVIKDIHFEIYIKIKK